MGQIELPDEDESLTISSMSQSPFGQSYQAST